MDYGGYGLKSQVRFKRVRGINIKGRVYNYLYRGCYVLYN